MRLFLRYIGVTEVEENIDFIQLARAIKILLKCVFHVCEFVHNVTNWITVLLVDEYFSKIKVIMYLCYYMVIKNVE